MNNQNVTVIMYHYVRDLINSRYPDIKGLDIRSFKNQIEFIKKNYNIIKMEDYYNILGVDENASQDDIKKAYRKLGLMKNLPKKFRDFYSSS